MPGPICPHPEAEGQARAVQCPACSLPGMGQELPGRAGAGLEFARSWGDGGEAGGEACVLPSHLLPHQMLLPGMGMCPLRTFFKMPWGGSTATAATTPPEPGMAQAITAPSPGVTPWSPPPIFPHQLPPAFLSVLPATGEDEEERAERMVNNEEPFWGGFSSPGWEKPRCWCPTPSPILQLTASTSVWWLW